LNDFSKQMNTKTSYPQRMMQVEAAVALGVSKQALGQSIKRLEKKGNTIIGSDGLVDFEVLQTLLAKKLKRTDSKSLRGIDLKVSPAAQESTPVISGDPEISFHIARTLREVSEAKMAALELASMQGKLVRVVDIERHLENAMASAVNALRSIVDRKAAMLAAETDEVKVRKMLDDEVDLVCQRIADCAAPLPIKV
jgi:hypothetical protein